MQQIIGQIIAFLRLHTSQGKQQSLGVIFQMIFFLKRSLISSSL